MPIAIFSSKKFQKNISFENSFENQLLQSAEYQHFQFIIQFLGTRKNSMLLVTTCNY